MIPNVAPQLSEATFRVFEPYIHLAIQRWPDETKWAPPDMVNERTQKVMSPNTFAARMRDSIVSYQRNAWESYIDREKFTQIYGSFAVAFDRDGSVWFRNRGRKGRPLVFTKEMNARQGTVVNKSGTMWTGWTLKEVGAAVILLHYGRIEGPIVFPGKIEANLQKWEANYNVAFFFDEANNQTVLS